LADAVNVEKKLKIFKLSDLIHIKPPYNPVVPFNIPTINPNNSTNFFKIFGWALKSVGIPKQNISIVAQWENIGISIKGWFPDNDNYIKRSLG